MRQLKITKQVTKRENAALENFLKEIGAIPLLKPDEEVELAKLLAKYLALVNEGKEKKNYLESRKRVQLRLNNLFNNNPINQIQHKLQPILDTIQPIDPAFVNAHLLKSDAELTQALRHYIHTTAQTHTTAADLATYKTAVKIIKKNLQSTENELKRTIQNTEINQQEAKKIIDRLVETNLRFVVSVAKQYQNQGLSLSDLINIGIQGLIKAIKRFDYTRGFKLISYSVCWIRQGILQALAEEAKAVRLPLNRVGRLKKINKQFISLEQQNERKATISEVAEALNMSESEIRDTLQVSNRHSSLNAPFVQGEDSTLLDVLEDNLEEKPDKTLMEDSLKKEIHQLIHELSAREKEIISFYFGIGRDHPMTLEEIGKNLNLTRERVRQIKEKSLAKLRSKTLSSSNNIQSYLGT